MRKLLVLCFSNAITLLFLLSNCYSEHAALAGDGVFEVDFAVVVFLDDAAGQRKAEAPAALFGREARLEEQFLV